MPFAEDFTAFMSPTEFATSVLVAGSPVNALFDNGYSLGSVGMLGMASSQPVLTLPTASVAANPVGAAVQAGGVGYLVVAHEPDGTGLSRLMLERVT